MTDNEIIKALECCRDCKCKDCPCYNKESDGCKELDEQDIIDLINRQKAEIERLKQNLEEAHIDIKEHFTTFQIEQSEEIKKVKNEIISEFNVRLYAYKTNIFIKGEELIIIPMSDYEKILKEMKDFKG